MYLCYIDESGDCGIYDEAKPDRTGSPYFILSGLIVHADKWKASLELINQFRRRLAAQAYLPYEVEFHCAEMIDPHKTKAYKQIGVPDRWRLISEFAEIIGRSGAFSIIAVVIDKKTSTINPTDYLLHAITRMYETYGEFLKARKEKGIMLFDRANEKAINSHARKLMHAGTIKKHYPDTGINYIIEDPIFKISTDSVFIQAADLITFTLKEQEFPLGSRKKFNAHRIFKTKLAGICVTSIANGKEGIVWI